MQLSQERYVAAIRCSALALTDDKGLMCPWSDKCCWVSLCGVVQENIAV